MRTDTRVLAIAGSFIAASVFGCGVGDISGELSLAELEEQPFQILEGVHPGEVFSDGTASVVVPESGTGLVASVLHDDGHAEILRVESLSDGRVVRYFDSSEFHEVAPDKEDAVEGAEKAYHPECHAGAYSLMGYKWTKKLRWRANLGSRPSNLGWDATRKALRRAISNITASRNPCGMADYVSARQEYLGGTSRNAQVSSAGVCNGNDGVNVMSFGALPSGVLAITCTYFDYSRRAMNSDIKFNKGVSWYPAARPATCHNRFSLRAVATHESGHAFGLGHVSESLFPWMTMSTNIGPCNNSAASLGRGDVVGLRKLY